MSEDCIHIIDKKLSLVRGEMVHVMFCKVCDQMLSDEDIINIYNKEYDKSGFLTEDEFFDGVINKERENAA